MNVKETLENLKNPLLLMLFTALVVIILILLGYIVVTRPARQEPQPEVNSTVIIDRISDEAFLVTKTVVVDQETTIEVDQGSAWSNFWWGETIEAAALIRLDIGVDFSQIDEDDVLVDREREIIRINIPEVEILDASQFGDIEVRSSRGVLKYLLENDPNSDHNRALNELIDTAKDSVAEDEQLYTEARSGAINLLELIVKDLGYELETN